MSILTDVRAKSTFEARNQQLSKGYNKIVKASKDNFEAFCKSECEGKTISQTFAYIKKLPKSKREATLYHVLQMWINKLSKSKSPATILSYFGVIKKLARHNGLKISNEDVKDNLTFPKLIREKKYVLTLDDIHLILKDSSWKKKGFYLFLLSSGMRPKEALSIRKKHIQQLSNGMFMITIPAQATKLKQEREAFVSKEVYPYLTRMLRTKEDNDLIWTGQENTDYAVLTADTTFRNLCDRIGLTQRYENVNRRKLNLYCFRGFFYAKASRRHGDEYAHKMIGHTGYLPQYDRKTLDEKMEMYKEFENELIADQTQKLKIENDILKKKQNQIDETNKKIDVVYNVLNKMIDEGGLDSYDEFVNMVKSLKK